MTPQAVKVDRPIFVVGNSRSGTWMMHGVLGRHPTVAMQTLEQKWVWKYGHYDDVSDRLTPEQATPKIVAYIRRFFENYQREAGPGRRVGEKTNDNALRLKYIAHVFPDAKIVHMLRDGRASAVSSARYWQKPFTPQYRKIFHVPLGMKFRLVGSYFWRKIKRCFGQKVAAPWGPCFPGIERAMKERSLIELCGMQWRYVVQTARAEGAELGPDRYYECRYERFCAEPVPVLAELLAFLELPPSEEVEQWVAANVHTQAVDAWKKHISDEELDKLMAEIEPTLRECGYLDGE